MVPRAGVPGWAKTLAFPTRGGEWKQESASRTETHFAISWQCLRFGGQIWGGGELGSNSVNLKEMKVEAFPGLASQPYSHRPSNPPQKPLTRPLSLALRQLQGAELELGAWL